MEVTLQTVGPLFTLALGVGLVVRGLLGGRGGAQGLLRSGQQTIERAEGWRVFLVGLTFVGLGWAWYLELRWLLLLTITIAFVELQEASTVISVWRSGEALKRRNTHVASR